MSTSSDVQKVGLIINPNAKRARKALASKKFFWEEYFDQSMVEITPDVPSIAPALERLKAKDITILAVYGGDGTLQRTVTAASKIWGIQNMPQFLVLKGGTANALIKNMGVRKKAQTYLGYYSRLIAAGKLKKVEIFEVPMLKLEDDFDNDVKYGFIFANGLAYKSVVKYQESGNPGAWETLKQGVYPLIARYIGLKSAREYFIAPRMLVDIDDKHLIDDAVNVIMLSTLKKLILWYAPFRGDIMDKGGFYGIVNHMNLDDLFANFFSLATGKIEMAGNVNDIFRDIKIKTDLGYMFDGELFKRNEPYSLRITRAPSLKVVILPVL